MKEKAQDDHTELDMADDAEYRRAHDKAFNTYVAEEIEAWQMACDEAVPSTP
jgi:hypothetical protein